MCEFVMLLRSLHPLLFLISEGTCTLLSKGVGGKGGWVRAVAASILGLVQELIADMCAALDGVNALTEGAFAELLPEENHLLELNLRLLRSRSSFCSRQAHPSAPITAAE